MSRALTRSFPRILPSAVRWLPPLILLYVLGGAFGYLGILSSTQTNILVLLLFVHIFTLRSSWHESKNEGLLVALMLYMIAMGAIHNTAATSTLTYIYYLSCIIIASVAGRVYARQFLYSFYVRKWPKYCLIFLVLQLAVVILQHVFSDQLASHAYIPFNPEDSVFGTFYLQSDATLGTICLLIVVITFSANVKWPMACAIFALSASIIALGHSKAMQGVFVFAVAPLIIYTVYKRTKLSRYRRVFVSIALILTAVMLIYFWQILTGEMNDFRTYAENQYAARDSWITAGRLAPWGQLFLDKGHVFLFGHGALTYYNPMTKQWLYNAGFSTFYGLYIDFGVVGISLYVGYQVITIIRFSRNLATRCFLLMSWVGFAAFNDALSNIEFMFALNFAMCFISGAVKKLRRPLHETRSLETLL